MKILSLYKDNSLFLKLFSIFLLVGGFLLLAYPKAWLTLLLNSHTTNFLDSAFVIITFLGNGYFVLILLLPVLLYRIKDGILITASYLLSGLLAQILKRIFDMPRPKLVFSGTNILHFVPGVDIYSFHSFPSGHAVTAFSFCLILSMLTKSKSLQSFYFVLALIISFSRVYLCQHFFIDVYFGAIIGVVSTIFLALLFKDWKKFDNANWSNYSFLKKITHKF